LIAEPQLGATLPASIFPSLLALAKHFSFSFFQSQAVASSHGLSLASCHLPHPHTRGSSGGRGELPSRVRRRWRQGRSSRAYLRRGGGRGEPLDECKREREAATRHVGGERRDEAEKSSNSGALDGRGGEQQQPWT
jgi:hypothetical protein